MISFKWLKLVDFQSAFIFTLQDEKISGHITFYNKKTNEKIYCD